MSDDDDFDFDLDPDLSIRTARLAYRIGKELGTEAKNFSRFQRGEMEWNELSHLQKTLFLGGDRSKYERIRSELRSNHQKRRQNASSSRPSRAPVSRRPRFNYDEF